jgi:hypothetical protein
LQNHTGGGDNIAIGVSALTSDTGGQQNIAIGYQSLSTNTTGSYNTAIGYTSLEKCTGESNVAYGFQSLNDITTGSFNTSIGRGSGSQDKTGSYNTYIGMGTTIDNGNNQYTNSTALGAYAQITASHQIVLGNSNITSLKCAKQTITALSDARDKTSISVLDTVGSFIDQLKPVHFEWNMREGGKSKKGSPEIGFLAQDLLEAQDTTGLHVPGLVDTHNPDKLLASYGTLIPVLVKAIQELRKEVAELKAKQ